MNSVSFSQSCFVFKEVNMDWRESLLSGRSFKRAIDLICSLLPPPSLIIRWYYQWCARFACA